MQSNQDNKTSSTSAEWQYQVHGPFQLELNGETYADPLSYIRALNALYDQKNDDTSYAYKYFQARSRAKNERVGAQITEFNENKDNARYSADERKEKIIQFSVDYYEDKLDYSAVNSKTGAAVTQLAGRRYDDQEDFYATGTLPLLSQLDMANKKAILKKSIVSLHERIVESDPENTQKSGTTLCSIVIEGNKVYTSSVGDSLAYACILDKDGNLVDLVQLNKKLDRPSDESEIKRVVAFMEKQGRTKDEIANIVSAMRGKEARLDNLALTRAIGDTNFDRYGLAHAPDDIDVTTLDIPPGGKIITMVACDGLTERLSHDQLKAELQKKGPYQTAQQMTQSAAQIAFESGSTDNITVLAKEVDPESKVPTFLSVFDGHGGYKISEQAAMLYESNLNLEIQNHLLYSNLFSMIQDALFDKSNRVDWGHEAAANPLKKFLGLTPTITFGNDNKRYFTKEIHAMLSPILSDIESGNIQSPLEYLKRIQKIADLATEKVEYKKPEDLLAEKSPTKKFLYVISQALKDFDKDPQTSIKKLNDSFSKLYGPNFVKNTEKKAARV